MKSDQREKNGCLKTKGNDAPRARDKKKKGPGHRKAQKPKAERSRAKESLEGKKTPSSFVRKEGGGKKKKKGVQLSPPLIWFWGKDEAPKKRNSTGKRGRQLGRPQPGKIPTPRRKKNLQKGEKVPSNRETLSPEPEGPRGRRAMAYGG